MLAALAALALPAGAFAHATLKASNPKFRQRLERAPATLVIRFDQKVQAIPRSIEVLDARGRVYSLPTRPSANPHELRTALRPQPKGAYTVRWRALSGDGHIVSGVYTYGVRVPAPEPTQAYGASGPTTAEHVVRWLYFVGLALLIGGLGFRLLVLRGPVPAALERRFYLVCAIGVVGVLETGIVAFLLRAHGVLQLPLGRFLYGDLSPIADGTRFGTAFIAMTLGFAVVAGLVFLAWLTDREAAFLWPALAVSLGLASGLSLSGHSAATPNSSRWSELADWVHLSAACLWTGGLVMLAVAALTARDLRRAAFVRFARLAPVLIAPLVAAGIYLSVLRLPAVDDLWTTGYGQTLIVKLALVALALAWGAAHHLLVRPRLERPGVLARLPRSLVGESAVGIAVLLVAAILVNTSPPAESPGPARSQAVGAAR